MDNFKSLDQRIEEWVFKGLGNFLIFFYSLVATVILVMIVLANIFSTSEHTKLDRYIETYDLCIEQEHSELVCIGFAQGRLNE